MGRAGTGKAERVERRECVRRELCKGEARGGGEGPRRRLRRVRAQRGANSLVVRAETCSPSCDRFRIARMGLRGKDASRVVARSVPVVPTVFGGILEATDEADYSGKEVEDVGGVGSRK